jgi:hypothetical protein
MEQLLIELREQLQEDILTRTDVVCDQELDLDLCDIIVNNINKTIEKIKSI